MTPGQAKIIVSSGNFHGRTTTIVSFSDDPDAHNASAPSPPASRWCPTATSRPSRPAIDADTVAVLIEPIQGEGGVVLPPTASCEDCARSAPARTC